MRLATIRIGERTTAARLEGDGAVEISTGDVGALLAQPDWEQIAAAAAGTRHALEDLDYAPLVPRPEKIICVGLNYRPHIEEMGREPAPFPTLFAKYAPALIGSQDDILLPDVSSKMDWEAELAVVIGRPVRHADPEEAAAAIGGYAILNDVTARDWQERTSQFLQGKTFEATTPFGPWLVTTDEVDPSGQGLEVTCEVDGERVQVASTPDLIFGPVALVAYLSDVLTLRPGDVIATGTPGGVGHGRRPPRYLHEGAVVVTRITGLGECRNACRSEKR